MRLLFILTCCFISYVAHGQSQVDILLEPVEKKVSEKKYADAEVICDQLIKKYPNEVEFIMRRAAIKDDQSDRRGALSDLRTALDIRPEYDTLLNVMAIYYQATGMFDSSSYYFRLALKHVKSNELRLGIINNLGATYIYQRKITKAINLYERYLKRDPNDSYMLINLASAYDENDEKLKAVSALKRALEIDQSIFQAYNNLGLIYTELDQYDSALVYLNVGLKKINEEKDKAYLYSNKGHCYHKMAQYDKALALYNQSIELGPENSWVYKNKAETYIAMGMKKEGCEYLQESKRRGFEKFYGQKVNELINKHCKTD